MYIAWLIDRRGFVNSLASGRKLNDVVEDVATVTTEYAHTYRHFYGSELHINVSRGPYTNRVAASMEVSI